MGHLIIVHFIGDLNLNEILTFKGISIYTVEGFFLNFFNFFFNKGSPFVRPFGVPGQADQLLRAQGHLGRCVSPLGQPGLFPGQVAPAARWSKLRGPRPPGVLEQAPPWSVWGVHHCCLQLGPQDLSLGPASGAENPVGSLPVVPPMTQGG